MTRMTVKFRRSEVDGLFGKMDKIDATVKFVIEGVTRIDGSVKEENGKVVVEKVLSKEFNYLSAEEREWVKFLEDFALMFNGTENERSW